MYMFYLFIYFFICLHVIKWTARRCLAIMHIVVV